MRKLAALAFLLYSGLVLPQPADQDEFKSLDLNADGKVSLAEAAGHAAVVLRFDRADRNKDGKLTPAELNRLKKLKIPVNEKARKAIAARSAGAGATGRR